MSLRNQGARRFENGKIALPVVVILLLAAFFVSVSRADELTNLAKKLAGMRAEVETLSNELELEKQKLKNELDSLAQQKSELDVQIEKERLRIQEIKASIERRREEIAKQSVSGEELKPLVNEAIGQAEVLVKDSLPFRTSERIDELGKIRSRMDEGLMRPEKAASLLWAFMEDELRLTRECALDKQIIVVDGREQLAEVARVGMVMLFFRTNAGRYGKAVKRQDAWEYEVFSDSTANEQTALLFDSFRKQVRVGYFELPNALADQKGGQ